MNKKKQAVLNILDIKDIYPVFQPIVDLETCQVVVYESFSRIENKELYMNLEELFKVSETYGYVWKLEKLCRDKALKTYVNKPSGTKIFLNVDGQIFQDSNFIYGFTNRKLEKFGLFNEDIVFEITERTDIEKYVLLQAIMNHYIDQGYQIALYDVGAWDSGLKRVVDTTPNYLKVDIELVCNIYLSKSKQSMMKLLVEYCDEMGFKLIAEGIET
ncbi:EAL domain-containing protein [Holdemanella biformis]|uniref:EAL domain-containing protein n=1 Tax=Holdemanella biformis TaxID=1735 RepID=UPI00266654F4|nr:EAL domain-containing protein [Holdemanella biformis]